MAAFALVVHRFRDEAVRVARETAIWLHEEGHEVRLLNEDADLVDVAQCGVEPEKLAVGLDLAISLGGDGTILRTVELVAKEGVPVLGVNVGRLGYLTHLVPSQLPAGNCNAPHQPPSLVLPYQKPTAPTFGMSTLLISRTVFGTTDWSQMLPAGLPSFWAIVWDDGGVSL